MYITKPMMTKDEISQFITEIDQETSARHY
jgi:hypothetical protein